MQIFITYYFISGILMGLYAHKNYDRIFAEFTMMEILPKDVFIVVQALCGFFTFPICIILEIKILLLDIKIKKLTKENKKLEKEIADNENKANTKNGLH